MLVFRRVMQLFPGLALATIIALLAISVERLQFSIFGTAWVDALVIAILLGTTIHTGFGLRKALHAGIGFACKGLLEFAIVLLGASMSVTTIAQAGGHLFLAVFIVVTLTLISSYALSRMLGLTDTLATLVACGNSICGNSAIVAVAPVIGAQAKDVASAISFTAALGILVVLLLPVMAQCLEINHRNYGIVAGMTVYAVPQVLAATIPVSAISVQIGTVVKLMRVLMLGPLVLLLGLRQGAVSGTRPALKNLFPWFIIGFLSMMALRSGDLIPEAAISPIRSVSTVLTIVSMAALGLSVDLKSVLSSGKRVLAAGMLSLVVLTGLSVFAIRFL
jgi:uncharacterized integral membrane protein (TIGR00698 family)